MISNKDSQLIELDDGRRMGFAEYGDPNGKPLFYLHGWPSSRLRSKVYDTVGKKLHIRMISPDRPGYGLSDFKKDRTLLDYPDDLVQLSDQLKIKKFAVVGVSGGGPYAAVCAYKISDRVSKTGIVVGLGPTCIPHILDDMPLIPKLSWSNYSRFPILATLGSMYRLFVEKYSLGILQKFDLRGGNDRQILETVKDDWKQMYQETWRQGYKAAEKDLLLYTSNWGFAVKDIEAPVYLWYGEADQNINLGTARYYHSQIKDSQLTIYPNEGHLISISHAEEIFMTLNT